MHCYSDRAVARQNDKAHTRILYNPGHPYKEHVELVREVVKGVRGGAVQPTYLVEPLIGMGWGALLLSLAPCLSLLVGGSLTLGVLDPRIGRSVDVGREETREAVDSGAKVQTKKGKT